jgi:hypothetical protein
VASIALVIGIVAFVAARIVPAAPSGPTAWAKHFDELELPASFELVEERVEGEGAPFFGEYPAVVRVYGTAEAADAACPAVGEALGEWGELDVGTSEPGTCTFRGRMREDSSAGFYAEVAPPGDPSSFATVVVIEIR